MQPAPASIQTSAGSVYSLIQGTNFPIPLLADTNGSLQSAFWIFPAKGYTSGDWTFAIAWYASATTGNVNWEVAVAAVTLGTDTGSLEAKAFATATSGESAVNANAKAGTKTTITVTGASLDSVADGDMVAVRIKRIAASSSEMTGDANFVYCDVGWS